jgi:3-hydroxyacyl-CoA dehydrogenase
LLNEYSFSIISRHDSGQKSCRFGCGHDGAQIAAHLANAGIPTLLLDIVPRDSKPTVREVPPVQDRMPSRAPDSKPQRKRKPAAFFTADRAALVQIGNFRRRPGQAERL